MRPDATEPESGSITTTYRDLGTGAPIVAPEDARPMEGVPTDPETQAAIDVLAELGQRRPDLCSDVELGPDDSPEEFLAAYEQCLRDAGEEAAADAFATLGSIADDRAAAGAGG
ncbi:MAG: hypothetical protein R2715_06360 [Ilumatobacteraceae bacterium]